MLFREFVIIVSISIQKYREETLSIGTNTCQNVVVPYIQTYWYSEKYDYINISSLS